MADGTPLAHVSHSWLLPNDNASAAGSLNMHEWSSPVRADQLAVTALDWLVLTGLLNVQELKSIQNLIGHGARMYSSLDWSRFSGVLKYPSQSRMRTKGSHTPHIG